MPANASHCDFLVVVDGRQVGNPVHSIAGMAPKRPQAARCIATIASNCFAALLDDMLGSLCAKANCGGALLVVFSLNDDERCRQVADKYGATVIPCISRARFAVNIKAVLYSVARVVDAEQYLCLDADMLVLRDPL